MLYLLFALLPVMALASDLKLELIQVLFRHGARTNMKSEVIPMLQYVDPALHETYGYEQLTNNGKAQAYNLGRALRNRYDEFLGPLYKPEDLYAYSSDISRTKMSLQLVLAALYPPSREQIWNENLRWQPIPTNYAPVKEDILLKAYTMNKYKSLFAIHENTSQYKEAKESLKTLSNFFLSKGISDIDKYGFGGIVVIFNVLSAHRASHGKLPDWYTDELFEELQGKMILYFDESAATSELCKWQIGPLIKRFLDNMKANEQSKKPKKIYLYSGHELNIAPFTRAHGIKEFRYPGFANAVILEKLRDSQNRLYVRMLAWTGENDTFTALKLGNDREYCPIDEYTKIIENVIPSNEEIDSFYDKFEDP